MKQEIFNLLDVINRRGISNDKFGFVQDVETGVYFGLDDELALDGQWLYLYINENDADWEVFEFGVNKEIPEPDYGALLNDEGEFLFLYKL